MSTINTGGPAFPSEQGNTPEGTWNQTYESGMTLRDYFAAKAMAAAIAYHGVYDEGQPHDESTTATEFGYHAAQMAMIAYVYADEMLAERDKASGSME